MEEDATKLGQRTDGSQHGVFFIYYSGHGCMFDNKTHGIDIQNEYIKLEEDILDDISCRSNTTLVAFFDCCRTPLKDSGKDSSKINENSSTESQYIVQYTCKVGN